MTELLGQTCHETPMRFFHCVGDEQAWRIIISHALVAMLYLHISVHRFVPAALHARTRNSKIIWWSIACMFPFCAAAGYLTTILAGWLPEIAYPLKEWLSHFDVLICLVFIWFTRNKHLQAVTDTEFRGEVERILQHGDPSTMLRHIKELL